MSTFGTEGLVALVAIVAIGAFVMAASNQRRRPSPFNVMLMWLTVGISLLAPTLLDLGPPTLVFMAIGARSSARSWRSGHWFVTCEAIHATPPPERR
jgi:hypothetical protein